MSSAIKRLTPEDVLEFVHTAVGSRWDGAREWEKVDIEISSFNYVDIVQSNEPIEFGCRIYSRERFSWLYSLSIRDVCDVIDRYLGNSLVGRSFRCEVVRYEMMKIPGTDQFSIEFDVKIVDSDSYTGKLEW